MNAQILDTRSWRKQGTFPVESWMPSRKTKKSVCPSRPKVFLQGKGRDRFSSIEDAIKKSKKILSLENDFDGEGSLNYSIGTWKRAVEFLRKYASLHWDKTQTPLATPKILPGPTGSIDVLWKAEGIELLVNFPADPHQHTTFYGDREDEAVIKGNLNPSSYNAGLLEWLEKE